MLGTKSYLETKDINRVLMTEGIRPIQRRGQQYDFPPFPINSQYLWSAAPLKRKSCINHRYVCMSVLSTGADPGFPRGVAYPRGRRISKLLLCRYTNDQDLRGDILTFPMHDAGNISKIVFEF